MQTVLQKAYLLIEKSGLTQQEIGERMGCSSESVRQFLDNTYPSVEMMERFAEAVGVDPNELV